MLIIKIDVIFLGGLINYLAKYNFFCINASIFDANGGSLLNKSGVSKC